MTSYESKRDEAAEVYYAERLDKARPFKVRPDLCIKPLDYDRKEWFKAGWDAAAKHFNKPLEIVR